MILGPAFEAPTVVAGFNDVALVSEAVEERRRHFGVGEDGWPFAWRDQVPTANFFQRHGYADNPVAQRNNVVGKLMAATDARMDQEISKPGAKELAAALR